MPGRGGLAVGAAALGLVLLGVACAGPDGTATSRPAVHHPSVSAPGLRTAAPVRLEPKPSPSSPPERERAVPDPPKVVRSEHAGAPVRVVVPRLGVDAPVVGIAVNAGVLRPPDDPTTLGWWYSGAAPGAARGSALITGHTVSTGGGALDDLETLRGGDRVSVRTATGRIGYRVGRVRIYRKSRIAHDAARLFSQEVPGRLVLVTCEDWNGSAYLSNVVVLADPL